MVSGIDLNPSVRIGQPNRTVHQDLEERMLIARLFGQQVPATEASTPLTAAAANPPDKSPLAPNVGQNVDVLA